MGQWRQATTGLQQYPRVTTDVPVRVTTVDPEIDPDSGATFFRSAEETSANLSRGGAFVRSWEPLETGRRVVLTIEIGNGDELQLVGRVAWTRRELRPTDDQGEIDAPGYGLEFVGGTRQELAALDQFLKGLESKDPSSAGPGLPPPTAQA